MRLSLATGPAPRPYPSHAPVVDREDEALAKVWHCRVSTAHQRKLRAVSDVLAVITVKRRLGHLDSLGVIIRRLEVALAHQPPKEENTELLAALADHGEDSAEATYRASPTEANARLLLQRRALERQTSLDHDRVIAARHGITL